MSTDKSAAVAHYQGLARDAEALRGAVATGLGMLHPGSCQAILDRCTLWPWVITLRYLDAAGQRQTATHIVQAPLTSPPDEQALLPAGATEVHADVFPASRFGDMAVQVRPRYVGEYAVYLLWRAAHAQGKTADQMQAWIDFDPVGHSERLSNWLRPGRHCGD